MKATVAHVIAGTVHNDRFEGHRITMTPNPYREHGGVVIVYDKAGNRVRTVSYEEMPRVEINWEVDGGV